MVRGGLENDTQDAIVVGKSVVESFQYHRANTITSTICGDMLDLVTHALGTRNILTAICVVVESLTIACLGQELSTTETGKDVGVCHHVEAASDRGVTVPCP